MKTTLKTKNRKKNLYHNKSFSLGIRGKIFLGFISIAIILVISTIFVSSKIERAAAFSKEIADTNFPTVDSYLDINGHISESQAELNNYLITKDERFKTQFQITWKNTDKAINKLDGLSKSWHNHETYNEWQTAKGLLTDIRNIENKILNDFITNNKAAISSMIINELQPKVDELLTLLSGPVQADGDRVGGMYDKSYGAWEDTAIATSHDLTNVNTIQHALLLFYVIAAIIIGIFTARSILVPLENAINIAREIAEGERDIDVVVTSNDETGVLLSALDSMLDSIKENERKLKESESRTRTLFENIVKTANAFSEHSSRVSKGDLTKRITNEDVTEMRQLGSDLNMMTDSLSTITRRITEASHDMVTTLEEVKQAVDVQSTGASEQASSINEITASLEEIEKSSAQTIEKAKTLGEVAERTRERGQMGLEAIEQSIAGMKSIREKVQTIAKTILELSTQSQQVGEITNVVNALAQQSKMLALNASIEAAKAGEAGKGFAVVAAEVKNLAEQSEHSTSQVQKILEDIRHATEKAVMATEEGTKGVDHGTELVEQTGEVVRNLSDVIHETTIASEQIAAAIRQEGVGIEQITAGMSEINQVTASFVASVKQTTQAIEDLASIAKSLKDNVDIYKI